jgi:hypothetical protein
MFAVRRTRIAAAIAISASLAIPASALAKGGTSTTPTTINPVSCDYALDGPVEGGYAFSNQVGDAGCVTAHVATGYRAEIRVEPGKTDIRA